MGASATILLMIWLRKGFVHILGVLLFISLVGGVAAVSLRQNFSKPDQLKSWLSQSKIYDKAVSAALSQTQEDDTKNGGSGSVSLSDSSVKQAAEQAFSPQLLETSVNTFIDSNYAWLQGKTGIPTFNIDLSSAKEDFATKVGKAVTARLTSLPVCTPAQLAAIQIPVDPLSIDCRPAILVPITEGARVTQEIRDSDFLNQPNLTADTVGRNKDSTDKPYYNSASKAPKYFQLAQKLPLIFAGLAALTTLGVLFISPTRRKGWRRVGVILTEAGIVLIASKFVADAMVSKVADKLSNSALDQIKQPRDDLVHQIEASLFQINLYAGIVFFVLAIAIFIYLFRTRTSDKQPEPAPVSDNAVSNTSPESNKATDLDMPTTQPRPPIRSSDEAPKIKKPPRQRLIQ